MIRQYFWIALQIVGSICSIISIIVLFVSDVALATQLTLIGLAIIGLLGAILGTILRRQNHMVRVHRQALIDTGITLMRGVKLKVVMFGSDMSWASDYEAVIRSITSQGKEVVVLYMHSQASGVLRNADILTKAGAILIATPFDSGIRGMLIDPYDHQDALLYMAYRKLKPNAAIVEEGEKSSSENYEYHAKIYGMKFDWIVIRTITKYYEILIDKSNEHRTNTLKTIHVEKRGEKRRRN